MKKIKAEALEKLKKANPNTYENICNSIISFSQNSLFKEAKELILILNTNLTKESLIKFDTNLYFPFLFLKAISKYLYNLSISEILEYNSNLKEETRGLIKSIKIILKYIEENYDKDFLLIKNKNSFIAIENALFLNSADELSTIFNHINYTKEADYLFMLKTKIELGFRRYFFNQQNKIIIEEFNEQGNIKFPSKINFLKILSEYMPTEVLLKEYNNIELQSNSQNEFEENLLELKLLKSKNKTEFTKEFNLLKKDLIYFPEFIWEDNYFIKYEGISKSINKDLTLTSKKINSKKVLVNLDSIKTINLVLQILKDE